MSGTTYKILILHGPNINLTGFREPDVYGKKPLDEIDAGPGLSAAVRERTVR